MAEKPHMNLVFIGHVDHGKSTLVGRLLLNAGAIEQHIIDRVPVKIYGIAKTIADCFKFRNKVGIDVAIEALREVRRNKTVSMESLWESAKVCRVTRIMRPYMEAMT